MSAAEKKAFDVQEFIESLGELDYENAGAWPAPVKALAVVLVLVVVVVLGYVFEITPKYEQLQRLTAEESSLMGQYEAKAFKAQNLDQYRKQLDEMEEMFGSLLAQLPKETEVPGLLEDITHSGLGSGLELREIKLGNEAVKEFYAELPIQISATGDYHGFGAFVSGVAALPRIVTLGDFKIERASQDFAGLLNLDITARTYRYSSKSVGQGGGR
jgi:type IV pilus assembly protein PilO